MTNALPILGARLNGQRTEHHEQGAERIVLADVVGRLLSPHSIGLVQKAQRQRAERLRLRQDRDGGLLDNL